MIKLELPSIEDFDALKMQVEELSEKMKGFEAREKARGAEPKQWIMQSEANKLFIGKGGKKLARHTFYRMIDNWLAQGDLIRNVTYMQSGDVTYISKDFLAGQVEKKAQSKPKR